MLADLARYYTATHGDIIDFDGMTGEFKNSMPVGMWLEEAFGFCGVTGEVRNPMPVDMCEDELRLLTRGMPGLRVSEEPLPVTGNSSEHDEPIEFGLALLPAPMRLPKVSNMRLGSVPLCSHGPLLRSERALPTVAALLSSVWRLAAAIDCEWMCSFCACSLEMSCACECGECEASSGGCMDEMLRLSGSCDCEQMSARTTSGARTSPYASRVPPGTCRVEADRHDDGWIRRAGERCSQFSAASRHVYLVKYWAASAC